MSYSDIIKKSVLEGFSYADFSTTKMAVTLGLTFLIAVYIFLYTGLSQGALFTTKILISRWQSFQWLLQESLSPCSQIL